MEPHYQTLGLSSCASKSEIRQKFRELAKQCHPDHHPDDPRAAEQFKKIAASYALLVRKAEPANFSMYNDSSQRDIQSLIWLLWTFSPLRMFVQIWM